MPIASSSRRWRTSWASQPNAWTPKRWKRPTRPCGPVGAVHVHHVDPELGELGGVALERDVDLAAAHRVHEVHLRCPLTQLHEQRGLRGAHPQPVERSGVPGHLHQHLAGGRVVDVEGELVVGAELGVEVGEPRDGELGQLGG